MGKRKGIPAALHSDLSEYSSLLRALRTSETLDLASQLTKPLPQAVVSRLEVGEYVNPPGPSTSTVPQGKEGRKNAIEKDNWTRWPLLVGDIHPPEFGFQDEIQTLAIQALESQRLDDSDEERDNDISLPQSLLEALTLTTSTYLGQVLAALAANIPPIEKSMQNRLSPITWEGVLEMIGASGLMDSVSLQDIHERLEQIYGRANNESIARSKASVSLKRKLEDLHTTHNMSFLSVPDSEPLFITRPRKRRRPKAEPDGEEMVPISV